MVPRHAHPLPLLLLLCLALFTDTSHACTAIAVGPLASTDGSTYTGSTADCLNCDFRLAKVPARDHAPFARRPVYLVRADYPHVVQRDRAPTWEPENLEGTRSQLDAWKLSEPMGYIPEVNHTYALFETGAGYGLINEHGVSLGESSCPGLFIAAPISDGGHALFDVSELGRVALERSKTARGAIEIMGALGEKYGYYGAEWDEASRYDEAGESLMVADKTEAWVFHILPDNTGRSAIWVAQRVPETDITAVANNFIIRDVVTDDTDNFMFSTNMHRIAEAHGVWNPKTDGPNLDFTSVFGRARNPARSSYTTLRIWRIFTLANPDLIGNLDPDTNALMDGYPFSVTPKKPLSRESLFRIFRDHFEGSQFDLTRYESAGPYGDPDRYDANAVGEMSRQRAVEGEFGRAISIFRTSYTGIGRSKASLPDEVGPLLYFSQQQPSSSAFTPLYVSIKEVPVSFTRGSLFRFSKESTFWAVTAVSNWVHRYYLHAVSDLNVLQEKLEGYDVDEMDKKATMLLARDQGSMALDAMQSFSTSIANNIHIAFVEFLPELIARFHDGYRMENANALRVKMTSFFYPEWWLKDVGYFTARETRGSYSILFRPKLRSTVQRVMSNGFQFPWNGFVFVTGVFVGAASCLLLLSTRTDMLKSPRALGYRPI